MNPKNHTMMPPPEKVKPTQAPNIKQLMKKIISA